MKSRRHGNVQRSRATADSHVESFNVKCEINEADVRQLIINLLIVLWASKLSPRREVASASAFRHGSSSVSGIFRLYPLSGREARNRAPKLC